MTSELLNRSRRRGAHRQVRTERMTQDEASDAGRCHARVRGSKRTELQQLFAVNQTAVCSRPASCASSSVVCGPRRPGPACSISRTAAVMRLRANNGSPGWSDWASSCSSTSTGLPPPAITRFDLALWNRSTRTPEAVLRRARVPVASRRRLVGWSPSKCLKAADLRKEDCVPSIPQLCAGRSGAGADCGGRARGSGLAGVVGSADRPRPELRSDHRPAAPRRGRRGRALVSGVGQLRVGPQRSRSRLRAQRARPGSHRSGNAASGVPPPPCRRSHRLERRRQPQRVSGAPPGIGGQARRKEISPRAAI